MGTRTKHQNLFLDEGEHAMLKQLAACMMMTPTQVLRQLIWVQHHRMAEHLKEHTLPAGTHLRLTTSGEFVHAAPLSLNRTWFAKSIEGGLLLDPGDDYLLGELARKLAMKPSQAVHEMVVWSAGQAGLLPKDHADLASPDELAASLAPDAEASGAGAPGQ